MTFDEFDRLNALSKKALNETASRNELKSLMSDSMTGMNV